MFITSRCLLSYLLYGIIFLTTFTLADNYPSTQKIVQGDSAPGTLRTIGMYPGDEARVGQTITQFTDGSVFVYGAMGNESVKNGEVVLDPIARIRGANSVKPAAVSWEPARQGWVKRDRPLECKEASFLHTATLLTNNKILFAGGLCDEPRMGDDDSPAPPLFNKLSLWNQSDKKWESAPSLKQGRIYHSASLLADGSVMIIGGEDDNRTADAVELVFSSVELFRDGTGNKAATVSSLAHLHIARARHTSTTLANNNVIVIGGIDSAHHPLAATEIWDSSLQVWRDGPPLNTARYQHSTVILSDGRLMIVGGLKQHGQAVSSVEIYNPVTNSWTETAQLLIPLLTQSATTLSNGDVLVIGSNFDEYGSTISRVMLWKKSTEHSTEQFTEFSTELSTEEWQPAGILQPYGTGDIHEPELYHLVPQKNGDALVFGNRAIMKWTPARPHTVDYYPASDRITYATTLLPDGRVLLAGGRTANNATTLAEIYDPATNKFTLTGQMQQARYTGMPYQSSLSSLVLHDGRVVIAGGWVRAPENPETAVVNSPDIWDPATGRWSVIKEIQFGAQDTVDFNILADGRILFFVMHVDQEKGEFESHASIWNPVNNQITTRTLDLKARSNGAIKVLHDGRVLIVGGQSYEFEPEQKCPIINKLLQEKFKNNIGKNKVDEDAEDEGDGDGNRCEAWLDRWVPSDNTTAELWDSNINKTTLLDYPQYLTPDNPQTLLLKNGNVVLLNTKVQIFSDPPPRPIALWDAQTKLFTALPSLKPELNWPMTELNDGSLIAWVSRVLTLDNAQLLKPGAKSWEPIPRFPTNEVMAAEMPSGELLALATTAPYVAVMDKHLTQWQLKQNIYTHSNSPALLEMRNGDLAVVGTISGNEIAVQIWNPKTDTWTMSRAIKNSHYTIGEAARLPSGAIMNFSKDSDGRLWCDIWEPTDDSWKMCGSFTTEHKNPSTQIVLGNLDDGRIVFISSSESATVYNEATNNWKTMKAEWNTDAYRYGEAVHADKPLARFFDAEKNIWFEAKEAAKKYYSGPHLSMLWDPRKNRWAYIQNNDMGRDAFWLADGCAISGLPFKIFNPASGKITKLAVPVMALENAAMIVLSDGTVVAVGDSRGPGEIGAEFFHGKASCNGFETLVGDTIFMPGVYASPETAVKTAEIPLTQESLVKGSIWNSLTELYYKLRWIALAILVPLILYFLLKNGIQWIRNKYPDGILTKPITASIPHRAFFSSTRIVLYSLVLLIAVPMLFGYLDFSLKNMQEDCESSPASDENNVTRSQQISTCVKKKIGIFSKLFKQANNSSPSLPCRYVGVWATSRKGDSDRTTLQADGKYIFEESTQGGYRAPEYGHWEVQSDNIVWYHRGMEDHPDVNKILNQTDTSFTLVEENGMHTNFELIEPLKTGACAK